MNRFIKYIKYLSLLILPLIFVFFPFLLWIFKERYNYTKENLILWTSFIPILSYVIGLLIGVLHKSLTNKSQYNESSNDNHH